MRFGALLLGLTLALFAQPSELDESLLAAARKGDLAGVTAALEKGATLEAKTRHGITPLYYAASNGHEAVVRMLIEKGANVNVSDTFYKAPVLSFVVERGHEAVGKLLVEKGSTQGPAVLADAAGKGMGGLVDAIVAKGGLSAEAMTLALSAAQRGKQEAVAAALIKAGAKEAPKADFQVPAEVMASYAGNYREERIGEISLTVKDNKLWWVQGGQPSEMGAFDATTFRLMAMDGINIKMNVEGGKAVGLVVTQRGMTFNFKRVEAK